jgi:serine/threonine protein kinase
MKPESRLESLSQVDQSTVETIIERFEIAWEADPPPSLEDFIPENDLLRKIVLVELIHADLDFKIKSGKKARIENYFKRFPDLKSDQDIFCELIDAEFHLRKRSEPLLRQSEYSKRFPDQQEILQCKFLKQSIKESMGDSQQQFGRYRILRTLGEGAMGAVFLAEDNELKRKVALKIPKFSENDGNALLERFYQEARTAATLHHPNICPVYDIGQIEGTHYISMAYIKGKPLSAFIIRSRQLDQRKIAQIIHKLAIALAVAHKQGVIHRDIKPANIIIDKKGQPVIMDFGLARQIKIGESIRLTQTGQIIGSPAYMSPEQVEESASIGPESDIYSLGIILYELLTGQLPFEGSVASVLGKIITQQPVAPSELHNNIDPALESLCLKMISKETEDRPASMKEVAGQLSQWLQQNNSKEDSALLHSLSESAPLKTRRKTVSLLRIKNWFKRSKIQIIAGLAACGFILVVITFFNNKSGNQPSASDSSSSIIEHSHPPVKIATGEKGKPDTTPVSKSDLPRTPLPDGPPGLVMKLIQHKLLVRAIQFSPDGKLLYSSAVNGLSSWDLSSGKIIKSVPGPDITSLKFSADGKSLFTGRRGKVQQLIPDSFLLKNNFVTTNTKSRFSSISVSPDGKYIAAQMKHAEGVVIWDISTQQLVKTLPSNRVKQDSRYINQSVSFLPDGRLLACPGNNKNGITQWDVNSGLEIRDYKHHGKPIFHNSDQLNVSADGNYFVASNYNRAILIDINNGKIVHVLRGDRYCNFDAAHFLPDGQHIVIGNFAASNKSILIWNINTGEEVYRFTSENFAVRHLAVSPDGRFIVSGGGSVYDNKARKSILTDDYDLLVWRLPKKFWPK